jgi:hypothetical protein
MSRETADFDRWYALLSEREFSHRAVLRSHFGRSSGALIASTISVVADEPVRA